MSHNNDLQATMELALTNVLGELLGNDEKSPLLVKTQITRICDSMERLEKKFDKYVDEQVEKEEKKQKEQEEKFVTQKEYWIVRTIVYGCAGFILIAFLGSIIITSFPHAAVSPI